VNQGYRGTMVVLERFNDTPVHNLAHLAQLVDGARAAGA
jgi:hypothetical protein